MTHTTTNKQATGAIARLTATGYKVHHHGKTFIVTSMGDMGRQCLNYAALQAFARQCGAMQTPQLGGAEFWSIRNGTEEQLPIVVLIGEMLTLGYIVVNNADGTYDVFDPQSKCHSCKTVALLRDFARIVCGIQ